MRKLVIILIAFLAVVTFIRAFDNSGTTLINRSSDRYNESGEFSLGDSGSDSF